MFGCFSNTYTGDQQIVKDGWLNSHANVRVLRQTEVGGDLLNVQIEVENTFPFNSRFNYKFDFFDAEGRMLYSPLTGFKQQQVPAGGFVTITGQASSPKATDFRLTLTNAD
jgi:hypothetical protein